MLAAFLLPMWSVHTREPNLENKIVAMSGPTPETAGAGGAHGQAGLHGEGRGRWERFWRAKNEPPTDDH